jgi:site-specific DNA-cytosine methylase
MGFPDSFKIRVSDTLAYQQFSQAMLVLMIIEVAKIMTLHILTQVSVNSK